MFLFVKLADKDTRIAYFFEYQWKFIRDQWDSLFNDNILCLGRDKTFITKLKLKKKCSQRKTSKVKTRFRKKSHLTKKEKEDQEKETGK